MTFRESPNWTDRFYRVYLPYCLQRVDGDRWVLLNRNYKPIGMHRAAKHVEYSDYAVSLPALSNTTLRKMAHTSRATGSFDTSCIWFYSDGCAPDGSNAQHVEQYFNRVAWLDHSDCVTKGDSQGPGYSLEDLYMPNEIEHIGGSNWQVSSRREEIGEPVQILSLRSCAWRYAKQSFKLYDPKEMARVLDAYVAEPTDLRWKTRSKIAKHLLSRVNEETPIGDLARDAAADDTFPIDGDAAELYEYLRPWTSGAFEAYAEFLDELGLDAEEVGYECEVSLWQAADAEQEAEVGLFAGLKLAGVKLPRLDFAETHKAV